VNDTITPLGTRVLIEVVEEEGVTASGLVIPDTAKEKQQKGVVVAVGDDQDVITVKVGEKVLFPKYTGTEITQAGREYLIIDATELLAVFGRSAS